MGTVFDRTKPDAMPALPKPDADGHISATESTRISLARSIICERTALGLTQEQLANLAGVLGGLEKRAEKARAGIITKSEEVMTIHQHTALTEHVGEFNSAGIQRNTLSIRNRGASDTSSASKLFNVPKAFCKILNRDWSSDVCSSDLGSFGHHHEIRRRDDRSPAFAAD